jgi:hypothetical protein
MLPIYVILNQNTTQQNDYGVHVELASILLIKRSFAE